MPNLYNWRGDKNEQFNVRLLLAYNPRDSRYCGNCGQLFVDLMTHKLEFGFKSMIVMFGILFAMMVLLCAWIAIIAIADRF